MKGIERELSRGSLSNAAGGKLALGGRAGKGAGQAEEAGQVLTNVEESRKELSTKEIQGFLGELRALLQWRPHPAMVPRLLATERS